MRNFVLPIICFILAGGLILNGCLSEKSPDSRQESGSQYLITIQSPTTGGIIAYNSSVPLLITIRNPDGTIVDDPQVILSSAMGGTFTNPAEDGSMSVTVNGNTTTIYKAPEGSPLSLPAQEKIICISGDSISSINFTLVSSLNPSQSGN